MREAVQFRGRTAKAIAAARAAACAIRVRLDPTGTVVKAGRAAISLTTIPTRPSDVTSISIRPLPAIYRTGARLRATGAD